MDEDPNDPRKPLGNNGKKEPPCPSTPATDLTSCASSFEGGDSQQIISLEEQREFLQRQIVQWGMASGTSLLAVTLVYVPAQIIAAFLILASLFMGFMHSLYQRARLEASEMRRRGLGHHLPTGLLDQLTNVSFHDWMVNGTFVEENQYLLLYLIPGISTEQRNQYIDRLVPRHQRILHRQGLGHFFGETFMRLLMGDTRYEEARLAIEESEQVPRRVRFQQIPETPNGLGEDGERSSSRIEPLGFESPVSRNFTWAEEGPAGSRERSANIPIRETRITEADSVVYRDSDGNDDNDDDNEEEEEEEDLAVDVEVLTDAIFGGIGSISNWALQAVRNTSSNFFTGTPLGRGLTMTAVATVSLGLVGMAMPRSETRTSTSRPPSFSTSAMVFSSVLASVGTAGIMYIFQQDSNGQEDDKSSKKQTKP